jgi:copper resistance protein C
MIPRDCPIFRAVAWGMMMNPTQPRTTVEDTAMSIRRAAAALLLSGMAVVATATPAFAQAEQTKLDASSPHQGATLAAPRLIVLSFTGHVTLPANPITVTGGNGASWTVGKAKVTGPVVTAPVRQRGPLGPYTVTYQLISDDGDAVTGTVSFTLISADPNPAARPPSSGATAATPPNAASSPEGPHGGSHVLPGAVSDAASTSDSGGIPAWVWILGAVAVLAIGMLEAFRVGRSKRTSTDPESK